MSLADVINLQISRSAPAVSRQGFGTLLILGSTITTAWSTDRVRRYTKAADMLTDGFTTSSPEYKRAAAAFAQAIKPRAVKIGRRLTAVAQVDTLTPNVSSQAIQHYIATINGVAFDFTSDVSPTATEVVTGLSALINAGAEPVTASGTTTLILTADQAGIDFSVTYSTNLTHVATTANVGVASDLAEISAADDDWYGLDLVSTDDEEIFAAARYVETVRKVFFASSAAAAVIAAGSSDIASRLKAASYARTFYQYSADYANGIAAGLAGQLLPLQPGSVTAKFKTIAGVTPDALTATQRSVALAKNANVYTTVGGLGMTEEGKVAVGEFLDVIIGVDWLYANMQADIFQDLMNNDKIPFTDVGASIIEKTITSRLRLAVKATILAADPAPTVTMPKVADISGGDKAARLFSGITFAGTLAGAIHELEISGNVSV